MSTSSGYAYDKFYSGVLVLATDIEPRRNLRERLKIAFADAIMHAGPPFDDGVPVRVASRIGELFETVRRGPVVDDDAAVIPATLDLMSDEELRNLAVEVVAIYGQLSEVNGATHS